MITSTERQILETIYYTCEVCGKKSYDSYKIKKCEKDHQRSIDCKHVLDYKCHTDCGNQLQLVGIVCKLCNKEIKTVEWKPEYWKLLYEIFNDSCSDTTGNDGVLHPIE